jgi:hypothetical protein
MFLREKFAPETIGPGAARMTDIVKQRRSQAETVLARLPADLAHTHRLDKLIRGGEKEKVRKNYFAQFSRTVQKAMLSAYEKGLPVGKAIAQKFFDFHSEIYESIRRMERRYGFKYDAKEFYIYHLIKGGKTEQGRFERWYNATVAADPRWVYKRHYAQLDDLHKAGFELQTYNPEELLQRRLFQSQMAINKVAQLRDAERGRTAYNVNRKDLTPLIKSWGGTRGELIARAPNGERYYMRPDAQPVLASAWDLDSLYSHRFWGPTFRALAISKANTIGLKLFGFTHMRHIGLTMNFTSFVNAIQQAALHGKLTPEVFWTEFGRMAKSGFGAQAEVQVLQGKRLKRSLTLDQKTNLKHWEMTGGSLRTTEAQQQQWVTWIHQKAADLMEKLGVPRGTEPTVHGAATIVDAGVKALTLAPIQDWQFHTFVPQAKFRDFLRLRDNLLRRDPELLLPRNEWKFKREMTRIGKELENRYGEMFYDNLLWPKMWKQVGTNLFLSLGWNLGALRMYGGAIYDASALTAKALEKNQVNKKDLTERMMFLANYKIINILQAGLINYTAVSVWNMMHPDQKQEDPVPNGGVGAAAKAFVLPGTDSDWVFPRVGGLDPRTGKPKRVSPVEYPREEAQFLQHIREEGPVAGPASMVRNKLNPIVSTLIEDAQNKNFYGAEVYDPNDVVMVAGMPFPNMKQGQDRVSHLLAGVGMPIGLAPKFQKPGGTWWDVAWGMFGFPPQSARGGRTDTENRVIDTFHKIHPQYSDERGARIRAGYDALRTAVIGKDAPAERAAEKALLALNVQKGTITKIKKNPQDSFAHHVWSVIPHGEQIKLLKLMSPDERKDYFKLMSPKTQANLWMTMMIDDPGAERELAPYFDPKVRHTPASAK